MMSEPMALHVQSLFDSVRVFAPLLRAPAQNCQMKVGVPTLFKSPLEMHHMK